KAVDFFEMYDRFGPGFAAEGNWARQPMAQSALARVGFASRTRYGRTGAGGATSWTRSEGEDTRRPAIPPDLPEAGRMRRGEKVYFAECVDCHGARGDGAGFLAEGFDVKPRDFRQGTYLFRSTAWGELPTMDDVERTVRDGVPGTTMPAWGQFLTPEEIGDVARYLVVFSPAFVDAWRARRLPAPFVVPTAPANLTTLATHGADVGKRLQCAQCHGADGKGHGPSAAALHDDAGQPAPPADLTYRWSFKNGDRPEDVYRTIVAGFNGTPMPSYAAALPDVGERWALVAWVLSLSPDQRPKLRLADYPAQRGRIDAVGHVAPAGAAK
ncbi:MAG TPA: c-type cytochrome, partial [Ideonella sp.]|nr:c-type cytochrome [Ideonella sp.]